MWGKLRRQFDRRNRSGELYYATHHHLVPLYVLLGICIVVIILLGCYLSILWKNVDHDAWQARAEQTIATNRNLYLPMVIVPAEKKQYVYSANVRFPINDPYNVLRYAYDPGLAKSRTSSTITVTTDGTLNEYERTFNFSPAQFNQSTNTLQQCSKLFVVRFEPGVVPFGGFTPVQEVKLKDGRTAFVHKNALCVPKTTAAMNAIDDIQQTILGVESY